MKRRTFMQLFGGAAVSVPIAKNLTFEVPDEYDDSADWDDLDDFEIGTYRQGPDVGDVFIFDEAKFSLLNGKYQDSDAFVVCPCDSDTYDPQPGRHDRFLGTWGSMLQDDTVITVARSVEWPESRDEGFRTEWLLIRNATQDEKFARIYLGEVSTYGGTLTASFPYALVRMFA